MKKLLTILLFFVCLQSLSQSEIFRRDASSSTGWEWKNASDVWADMVLYNDPVLADGIGNITSGSVTIEGQIFTNSGSTNDGACLRISASNVTIDRCFIGPGNDEGFYIDIEDDITIQNCLIANVSWNRIQGDGSNNNIKIINNQFLNMQWDEVVIGCCRGQFVALDNVRGTGNQINDNEGENLFGENYNEDLVNPYNSGGTSGSYFEINDNTFRGGGTSTTSGGLLGGDGGSSYINYDGNRLVNTGWYGIQICGGSFMNLSNNQVYSIEFPWSGVGIFVKNSCATCSDITVGSTNDVYWRRSAEIYGSSANFDFENELTCGSVSAPTSSAITPATMTPAFPDRLITYISVDDWWYLRSLKWRYDIVVQGVATYTLSTFDSRADARRPIANAGSDQPSVTTTTASLSASGSDNDDDNHGNSFLTGKTNSLTGYNWVQVSGPNTATMSAATSSTNNLSGLITGVYVFRLEVEQTNTEWGLKTYHADWVTVTVSLGTNYYISNTGSNAANGTSTSTPWQTISKINSSTFSPGDSILFKRGDMWREQLTLVSSGSAGNPITFSAYGTGAKPIINGGEIITSGWTNSSGNVWWINNPNATTTRAMVVINEVIYYEQSSLGAVNAANEYFIDLSATPDRIYIYTTTSPNTISSEISKRNYCILGTNAANIQYLHFYNLDIRMAGQHGLALYGTEGEQFAGNCIVDSCDFYACRTLACVAYDGHSDNIFRNSTATYSGNGFYSWMSDNITISNCYSAHNIKHVTEGNATDGHGFAGFDADNFLVENCISDGDFYGINIEANNHAKDGILRYNKVYNSQSNSDGINVGNLAAGGTIQVYYNLIVNCGGTPAGNIGSFYDNAGMIYYYNNTCYNNEFNGSSMFLNYGANIVSKNNIFFLDGGDFHTIFVVVFASLPVSNYNLFYQSDLGASPNQFFYDGNSYTTLANWRTATSQDLNSLNSNPLFVNVASDWSLQAGSPAINAGVDVGLTTDILGNPIVGLPDIGAFERATSAANYYFSNTGSDVAAGTIGAPWQTITKFNSVFASLSPGDSVLFKRGDTFYGSLIISRSGAAGNPIVIGAYGTGAKPVITGFTTVSAWSNLGSNIWESTSAVSTLSTCNMVTIGGVNYAMGRIPNSGYYTYQSHVTNTTVTSSSLNSATTNWTGADVVIRKNNFITDRSPITAHSGGTLTYTSPNAYNGTDGYGLFIQNDARTLDVQNEWYYDPSTKKIKIYSSSSPVNVNVATVDSIVKMNGRNNITFTNLSVTGSNTASFSINFSHKPQILNCSVDFSGIDAIKTRGGSCDSTLITNTVINHTNNTAVDLGGASENCLVSYDTIRNTGLFEGMGANISGMYGVYTVSDNNIIENCFIDSVGYNGIDMYGDDAIVRNNFITNYCLKKIDGAGVYTYIGAGTPHTGQKIYNNIVLNGIGSNTGTTQTGAAIVHGIYIDEGASNIEIYNNTAASIDYSGLYIHSDNQGINAHDNTFYNNGVYQVLIASYNASPISTLTFKKNKAISRTSTQKVASWETVENNNTAIPAFGSAASIDSNYLARPIDDDLTIQTKINTGGTTTQRTLAGWVTYSAFDAHSNKSPQAITDVNDLRFEYNETASNKVVSLPYNYMDVTGATYNGTITLQPYTSAVLIKNGAINNHPLIKIGRFIRFLFN